MLMRKRCIGILALWSVCTLVGYQKLCYQQWNYVGAEKNNPFKVQDCFLSFGRDGRDCYIMLSNRDKKKLWQALAPYDQNLIIDAALINSFLATNKDHVAGTILQDYVHHAGTMTISDMRQKLSR